MEYVIASPVRPDKYRDSGRISSLVFTSLNFYFYTCSVIAWQLRPNYCHAHFILWFFRFPKAIYLPFQNGQFTILKQRVNIGDCFLK